jgi:hypothetical protein
MLKVLNHFEFLILNSWSNLFYRLGLIFRHRLLPLNFGCQNLSNYFWGCERSFNKIKLWSIIIDIQVVIEWVTNNFILLYYKLSLRFSPRNHSFHLLPFR